MGSKQTWEKEKIPGNEEASVAHLTSDFLSRFKKKVSFDVRSWSQLNEMLSSMI